MTMLDEATMPGAVCSPLDGGVGPHRADVAVLFARADSHYKTLPGVDAYDIERDARTYDGPWPVVAHPPCRAWGRLRHMASPRADERNLARLAVAMVREFGGVLEHPAASTLWPAQRLPEPGQRDGFGGWTLPITQHAWGHRAEKATRLYIVGCEPRDIPQMPLRLGDALAVCGTSGRRADGSRNTDRPEISKAEREHTPLELALWLVELARRCQVRPNVEFSGVPAGHSSNQPAGSTSAGTQG